jgi:hypothetical protein
VCQCAFHTEFTTTLIFCPDEWSTSDDLLQDWFGPGANHDWFPYPDKAVRCGLMFSGAEGRHIAADVPYRHAVQFSTPPFFTYTAASHSFMGKRTRCESAILRRPSQVSTKTENRTRQFYTAPRVNAGSRLVHKRDWRFYCEGEFSVCLLQLHLTLPYRTWQTPLHDRRWSSILMHRGS